MKNKPFIWPNNDLEKFLVFIFCEVCIMNLADLKANECISLYKPFSSEDVSYDRNMQEKTFINRFVLEH